MTRAVFGVLAISSMLAFAGPVGAQRPGSLISEQLAGRYGLHRAWVMRAEVDPARGRVAYAKLQAGVLLIQTDQGCVQVVEPESRRTLWTAHVGRPGNTVTQPAASDKFVASTNGGNLYLFDRQTGRLLWEKKLETVPSTGPALSDQRVYLPLVSGILTSYRLPRGEEDLTPEQRAKETPLRSQGFGMADSPPVVSPYSIVWGTQKGNVHAVNSDDLRPQFRFRAHGAITAPVVYHEPFFYTASRDGFVYALRRQKGVARWQYSVGKPVVEPPVVFGTGVFVIPETGGLIRLDDETGVEQWAVPDIYGLVAASASRLYTIDNIGRMVIVDINSGARLGTLPTERLNLRVINTETDRIYLGTREGLIQCLHERNLAQPLVHNVPEPTTDEDNKKGKSAGAEAAGDEKPKQPAAADGEDLFGEKKGADGDEGMPADDTKGDDQAGDDNN